MDFVVTVDDAGLGQPCDVEERCVAFFELHQAPVSFFVVPCQKDGSELAGDVEWVRRARRYEAHGHDYQLHGYQHAGYEFGAPPWWMVQICGESVRRAAAEGYPEWRDGWTDDALRRKFTKAIAAFTRVFERPPQVFRAGCLAAEAPAFRIMAELGLRYDSDKVVDPRGWEYMAQKFDTPIDWDAAVPPRPYAMPEGVIELPCTSEYAWTLSQDTLHHFIDLARQDMRRVGEAGGVFILMCHQQRVGGTDDLPRQVLDAILTEAKRDHDARFMTLATLVQEIEAGKLPVAPGPTQGGDA